MHVGVITLVHINVHTSVNTSSEHIQNRDVYIRMYICADCSCTQFVVYADINEVQ